MSRSFSTTRSMSSFSSSTGVPVMRICLPVRLTLTMRLTARPVLSTSRVTDWSMSPSVRSARMLRPMNFRLSMPESSSDARFMLRMVPLPSHTKMPSLDESMTAWSCRCICLNDESWRAVASKLVNGWKLHTAPATRLPFLMGVMLMTIVSFSSVPLAW